MDHRPKVDHQPDPEIVDWLARRERCRRKRPNERNRLGIHQARLHVEQTIRAMISAHGDLALVQFFAFDAGR